MATQQEVYELIMQIKGAQTAEDLREKIERVEDSIGKLWEQMRHNPAAFEQAVKKDAETLKYLNDQLKEAERAAGALGGASRNSGRAMLEFSRAAEDAQYGVAGVLNNLPGLITSLGGGAGLVGALSLAAIAANQLYVHWNDLAGVFGGGHIKSEAEEMTELAKATKLTADEFERLARHQALTGKAKELRGASTKEEAATERAVSEAITEAGTKNVVRGLLGKDGTLVDGKGTTPAAIAEVDQARKDLRIAEDNLAAGGESASQDDVDKRRMRVIEAEKKLNDAREETALQLAASASLPQFYPKNLGKLTAAVQGDPAAFAGGDKAKGEELLKGLQGATPEARKRAEEIDAEADRAWDDLQESIKSVKEWSKDFKAKVKQAVKDKSFLGKDDADLTGAQIQAKKQFAAREAKIADARRTRSYAGKESEEMTPEETIAKRRDEEDQREKDKQEQARKKAVADAKRLSGGASKRIEKQFDSDIFADSKLQQQILMGLLGGKSLKQTQDGIKRRLVELFKSKDIDLSDEDARKLADEKISGASKGLGNDLLQDGGKDDKRVERVGPKEFADKVQSAFKQDDIPKNQLEYLKKILEAIRDNPGMQQQLVARFG